MNTPEPGSSPGAESSGDCRRVCLTPTRNEAWIIRNFIAATKLWANHIVVADQGSTDGTLQQLEAAAGVDVVINNTEFDELHRQRLLVGRARQIAGRRILIALDADEALSANCLESKEWRMISQAKPGTVLRFRWVNLLPGLQEAWIPPQMVPFGFVDDGTEHTGGRIHNRRVPCPTGAPTLDMLEIVVLHFQYLAWNRMVSKHRWYQAWEYTAHKKKSPLEIFREYHHMYGSWGKSEIYPVRPEWLEGYDRAGINFRSLKSEDVTWWDHEVIKMLYEHGPEHFRKLAIWDTDWNSMAAAIGCTGINFADPRSASERIIHRLLGATQKRRSNWGTRVLERCLRSAEW
ncbi:MAG: glycosyltransferase family 2 protein [Verrucomicrobiota bacterium]